MHKETRRQRIRLGAVFLLFALIAIGLFLFLGSGTSPSTEIPPEKLSLTDPISQWDAQGIWRERLQKELQLNQKEMQGLKEQMEEMKKMETLQEEKKNPPIPFEKGSLPLVSPSSEVNSLEGNVKGMPHSYYPGMGSHSISPSPISEPMTFLAPVDPIENRATGTGMFFSERGLDHDELALTPNNFTTLLPEKNPDTFVPAGTFVEAIMLGAADASTGVSSTANPSPMLFRIVAEGTLPNHHHSHLKDCVVTAAVVGDISSERGEIRLERLSCTFPDKEVVEQTVEGTVFGLDAKNGVRGKPVWREGALLQRAAAAGLLSGLAQGVSQQYVTSSTSPLGNSTQTVASKEILQYGVATGAANALEKLADYHVKRAEQYHPVIQLTAGQSVDIVFLKGFYLHGKKEGDVEKTASFTSSLEKAENVENTQNTSLFTSPPTHPSTDHRFPETSNTAAFAPSPDELLPRSKESKERSEDSVNPENSEGEQE